MRDFPGYWYVHLRGGGGGEMINESITNGDMAAEGKKLKTKFWIPLPNTDEDQPTVNEKRPGNFKKNSKL